MRTLLLLPVLLVIVLQLAIKVEIPQKWPDRRWSMKLVDSDGTVLSFQDESDTPIEPILKPGTYVVQAVFPGITDFAVNLIAAPFSHSGLMINVNAEEDGPMLLIDDESGEVVFVFFDGRSGARVQPGRYSLKGLTDAEDILAGLTGKTLPE